MKKHYTYIFILWISSLFTACQTPQYQGVTIATSANVQYAMQELTQAFSKAEGIPCQTVIGSSGKLTAQIKEGAPYDIFVSANMKYPEHLYKSGLTTQVPKVYAQGKLVLWTSREGVTPNLITLTQPGVRHIAVANPKSAPYGQAALEVMKKAKFIPQLNRKLVYGESIAQTNQFILSQNAEIGFTAKSVVVSPKMKAKGQWIEIPDDFHSPINQGVVLLKQAERTNQAAKSQKFYEFLFSAQAQQILQKYGYQIPNKSL